MHLKERILMIIFLFVFIGIRAVSAQDGSELKTIIEGSDLGDMMVASGQGSLIFEYVRVDSLSAKAQEDDRAVLAGLSEGEEAVIHNQESINISFAFTDPKMRCNENSINRLPTGGRYNQNWYWAYNGEKMELLRLDELGKEGLIIPIGSVKTDNVIPVNRFDPGFNGMKILGTPVGTFLRGSLGDGTVKDLQLVGEELQDNIPCEVIRGLIADTGNTITVWLAPNLMYRPKHVEIRSSDSIIKVHNTFREYTTGIWFPELIVKKEYYIDKKTDEEVLYKVETLAVQSDFALNMELPNEMFEVDFPIGLMVYDYRTGEEFEVK